MRLEGGSQYTSHSIMFTNFQEWNPVHIVIFSIIAAYLHRHPPRPCPTFMPYTSLQLSSNGDLDLNTSLDVDDDLLDDLGRGVQVNETLVDAHLIGIPGLGTLTARSLAGGDLEVLGGEADGALDAEVLGLSAADELLADLCKGN